MTLFVRKIWLKDIECFHPKLKQWQTDLKRLIKIKDLVNKFRVLLINYSGQEMKLFDDLDVSSGVMNQVFDNVNAGTVNENEVNQLIGQIAQQNGMKLSDEFADVKLGEEVAQPEQAQQVQNDRFPGI